MFGRFARPRAGASAIAVAAVCAGIVLAATRGSGGPAHADVQPAPADVRVQIGEQPLSPPLRGGFVGLSLEFPALPAYTGRNPGAIDPVFEQLIRNLAPGQEPVVRIGGDSSDVAWWPVRRMRRPAGVSFTLTPHWLATARALARALGARLILGVDLEAGRPALAAAEGRAFVSAIGPRYLRALEIGNEPNRYSVLPWYQTAAGVKMFAREVGYGFEDFADEFAGVRRLLPAVPLAGPTLGGFGWLSRLPRFLASEPAVGVVSFHRYPLNRCFTPRDSPTYPTIAHLLSRRASRGLVAGLDRYVALAHRRGIPFRVDEMNSVACGGKRGVSDTFAAALWALDTLFAMARAGVDGVNVHTFPGAVYQLFRLRSAGGQWRASVWPEYYGLMMFAQAAPPGSRLVAVQISGRDVRAWAARGTAGRLRVVLINDDTARAHRVAVKPPPGAGAHAGATVERLRAPSVTATSGVMLGGRSFGPATSTGVLAGEPRLVRVMPAAGTYAVALPPASAALITIPAR
jgi:hypothetical protein